MTKAEHYEEAGKSLARDISRTLMSVIRLSDSSSCIDVMACLETSRKILESGIKMSAGDELTVALSAVDQAITAVHQLHRAHCERFQREDEEGTNIEN